VVGGRSGRLGAAPGGGWVEGGHLPVRRWLRDETPNVLEDGVEQLVVDKITKAEAEGRKRESDAAYLVQMRRESGAAHYIVAYGRHARPCCGKEACRTTRLNSVSYVNARAASSDICDGTGRRCVSGGAETRERQSFAESTSSSAALVYPSPGYSRTHALFLRWARRRAANGR